MKKSEQEIRARRIIERFRMFNRKERDHLMKFALLDEAGEPTISVPLWRLISRKKGARRPGIEGMFIGMDYHLNWLFAALKTSVAEGSDEISQLENVWGLEKPLKLQDKRNMEPIQGNQEDVDLLVAWIDRKSANPLRLTLIEAKLDSPWKEAQLDKKLERIALIQASSIALGLTFIEWNCLFLSPKSPDNPERNPSTAVRSLQDQYETRFRAFSSNGKPMLLEWKEWNGQSPHSDRFLVNRFRGDTSKWKVKEQ